MRLKICAASCVPTLKITTTRTRPKFCVASIDNVRNVDSVSVRKIFSARDNLFGDDRLANTAKLFARERSIVSSLKTIGLATAYKSSKFIHAAIENFFRHDVRLSAPLDILRELDADFDAYRNIFPAVADALIPNVHYFGVGRFVWQDVSPNSREIFCN